MLKVNDSSVPTKFVEVLSYGLQPSASNRKMTLEQIRDVLLLIPRVSCTRCFLYDEEECVKNVLFFIWWSMIMLHVFFWFNLCKNIILCYSMFPYFNSSSPGHMLQLELLYPSRTTTALLICVITGVIPCATPITLWTEPQRKLKLGGIFILLIRI